MLIVAYDIHVHRGRGEDLKVYKLETLLSLGPRKQSKPEAVLLSVHQVLKQEPP